MERRTPRLRRLRVSAEKKPSTALIQEADVGEIEVPARMAGEPGPHLGMLVRGVVIGDGVDHFTRRYGQLDRIEEADEFLMLVLVHAAAEHGAFERVAPHALSKPANLSQTKVKNDSLSDQNGSKTSRNRQPGHHLRDDVVVIC